MHQNRAIITSDTDKKLFIRDENFPATRSRILLPLTIRNNIIGLLDLHSETKRALNIEDVEILQTLADLTAISFDNVRLLNETRNLLTQLEATSSMQTQQIWRKLTSRELPAYQYTPAGVRPIFNRERNNQENEGLKNSADISWSEHRLY
ncbi:MAG: putative signaling protein [Chloroflexi bacterium OLB14]|nr:MAG: putative signaling protein [Chloroflexi bacterium OLB14]